MSANPVPTTREELNYKVVETYDKILDDCVKGVITLAQADYAVRTLLAATGWAVTKETFVTLSDWETDIDPSFYERRVFSSATKWPQVIRKVGGQTVKFYMGGTEIRSFEADSVEETASLFERVCQSLKKKGYQEIQWPKLKEK